MKDQIINIRVDSELKDQIKHRAESLDLNVSEYLLECHKFNESCEAENLEITYKKVDDFETSPSSLNDIRSILESDMEDSVKVSIIDKIL